MYGIKYKVPFKSISNTAYEIRIELLDYTGGVTELIGGADPIIIDTDTDDVLTPIRASKATVQVYGSDYLQDLYTSDPQGIRVSLYKGAALEWLGYMTPDTFSQDFSRPDFIYEIECVCALSTLKYRKFTETSSVITFLDLIRNAATLAGYSDLYLTRSTRGLNGENLFASCSVACGNFYDELGEGMSYYEILEEIAKYFVCSTFVPFENALYLVDYLSIKLGINNYYKYNPTIHGEPVTSTRYDVTSSQTLGYKGTGATLSRIAGKNKATVNCSLYEMEDIVPEFDDEQSRFVRLDEYLDFYKLAKVDKDMVGYIRHYDQPKYTFYRYVLGSDGSYTVTPTTAAHTPSSLGSGFVRTAEYDMNSLPSKLSFENEVLVKNSEILMVELPAFAKLISLKSASKITLDTSSHLCINLSQKYVYWAYGSPDIIPDPYQSRTIEGTPKFTKTFNILVPCILRIGEPDNGYVYNGLEWVAMTALNQDTTFNVPLPVQKDDFAFGKYFSAKNTNTFLAGIKPDLSGYMVREPPALVIGKLELIICSENEGKDVITFYKYKYIKDISVEIGWQDFDMVGDWSENASEDVMYETVASDKYVEAADDIDLKICTRTSLKPCYSSVLCAPEYLEGIYSESLDMEAIAENLILEKVVSIYKAPRFVINPTLKNDLKPYSVVTDEGLEEVMFVNCGGTENVLMETISTNLIEI